MKKHIQFPFIMVLLLFSIQLFAVPAKPTPTKVTQPDGTVIEVIAHGNEYYHYTETTDGYVVMRNRDGWWVYAELDAQGAYKPTHIKVRPSNLQSSFAKSYLESIGKHIRESNDVIMEKLLSLPKAKWNKPNFSLSPRATKVNKVLLLLVQFPDLSAKQAASSFQRMINDPTWHQGSMASFYEENSYGMLTIQADYQDWITVSDSLSYYANENPNGYLHVAQLVREAVDVAEQNGVDFSQYDNDGDGVVDGLFIVHAGPGAEEGGQTQYIWSHRSSISWANLDVQYDGVTIDDYIIMPELYNNQHVEIGVFCHEYGHMLGLPDLYDTNGSDNGDSEGLSTWAVMAGGSWGGNGYTPELPTHFSAYSKIELGFVNPTVVEGNQNITVRNVENYPDIFKIWLDPLRDSEYLLVENRQKTGFDANLMGDGLLIYHIDRDYEDIYPGYNSINIMTTHLGVKILQADGLNELDMGTGGADDGDPFPGSTNNKTLNDNTTPNTKMWNGTASGVSISNISNSGNTMTAYVIAPSAQGYTQEYYEYVTGSYTGNASANTAHGLVKFIPSSNGYLDHVKVFTSPSITYIQVRVYSNFSNGTPSNEIISKGTITAGTARFLKIKFNTSVPVQANVPVYVDVEYTKNSGGFAVPIDGVGPSSGNCFYSEDGTNYQLIQNDIPLRAAFTGTPPTDIEDPVTNIPLEIEVEAGYPNPFNSTAIIPLKLNKMATVKVQIYDIQGKLVKTLVNNPLSAGSHKIYWNGDNEQGITVSSGIYFYRVESQNFHQVGKLVLVK
jgi:M6 family metalloprotease-like protein